MTQPDALPAPLVPPDCDLSDFKYMPLDVTRLRRSRAWLICKRRPDLAFYMLNLWTASWQERPTASLEDDDDVLADAAMCAPDRWHEIKPEVMRGWIKCADGRLYHETVAEKARDAWYDRQVHRWERECDRLRKENRRRQEGGEKAVAYPPRPERMNAAIPPEVPPPSAGQPSEIRPKTLLSEVKVSEGKVSEDSASAGSLSDGSADRVTPASDPIKADFDEFYAAYPRHVGPEDAERAYRKARKKGASAGILLQGAQQARRYHEAAKTEVQYIPHAATWLNRGGWRDEYPAIKGQHVNGADRDPYHGLVP